MRILQATAWYPPSHRGGTEVYLTGLVRALRDRGALSRVVTPSAPNVSDARTYDGSTYEDTTVRRYAVNATPTQLELFESRPHQGFDRFREILAEERPDIYHQHSWSRGMGAAHLRAARAAGLRTVLTVHTPDSICLRGTMMKFGSEVCDGRIDLRECAACWACRRGVPKPAARALAAMRLDGLLGRVAPHARLTRAVSPRRLVKRHARGFVEMVSNVDRIVTVCRWSYDALVRNGVCEEKLVLSRHGLSGDFVGAAADAFASRGDREGNAFRLVYLGRCHPTKGIHVLLQAVSRIARSVPLSLSIHAIGHGLDEQNYAAQLRRLARNDSRIVFGEPIARADLPRTLAAADAIAVPSLWLETGPLVVLEAMAAGTPVLGSDLGGIAELIGDNDAGTLVPPGDVDAWAKVIESRALGRSERRHTRPVAVRTMGDVADDMVSLYRALCSPGAGSERIGHVAAC